MTGNKMCLRKSFKSIQEFIQSLICWAAVSLWERFFYFILFFYLFYFASSLHISGCWSTKQLHKIGLHKEQPKCDIVHAECQCVNTRLPMYGASRWTDSLDRCVFSQESLKYCDEVGNFGLCQQDLFVAAQTGSVRPVPLLANVHASLF